MFHAVGSSGGMRGVVMNFMMCKCGFTIWQKSLCESSELIPLDIETC